jgi:hypothetical protein
MQSVKPASSCALLVACLAVPCTGCAGGDQSTAPTSSRAGLSDVTSNTPIDLHPSSRSAEYAVRWRLPRNGFNTASEVINKLREHPDTHTDNGANPADRMVTFFATEQPKELPPDYEASLRRRSEVTKKGKEVWEFTYKVRGHAPWPLSSESLDICGDIPVEDEWDITVGVSANPVSRMASLSCSIKSQSKNPLPSKFTSASRGDRPCKIEMQRSELPWPETSTGSTPSRKDLKIEKWTFTTPAGAARTLLEVSWKASASQPDEDAFLSLIQPIATGLDAQPPSKEKMAAECDNNTW